MLEHQDQAYAVMEHFVVRYNIAAAPILKFFDGSDDITFATFNTQQIQ